MDVKKVNYLSFPHTPHALRHLTYTAVKKVTTMSLCGGGWGQAEITTERNVTKDRVLVMGVAKVRKENGTEVNASASILSNHWENNYRLKLMNK